LRGERRAAPKREWRQGTPHTVSQSDRPRLSAKCKYYDPGPGLGTGNRFQISLSLPRLPWRYHVMNASTVSSISSLRYPIASLPQLGRLSAHSSPLTVDSGSTLTLNNHSSGASMAPTLGYLTRYPLPPPPRSHRLRVLYAHKEESGR
jgi:hypothetical protein